MSTSEVETDVDQGAYTEDFESDGDTKLLLIKPQHISRVFPPIVKVAVKGDPKDLPLRAVCKAVCHYHRSPRSTGPKTQAQARYCLARIAGEGARDELKGSWKICALRSVE